MDKLEYLESAYLKKDQPSFKIGDTLEVGFTVHEGEKTRLQIFTGILISRRGKGLSKTFTLRKISFGEGVERTFLLHSPILKSIKVVKMGKVRRAKLYYLRKKIGKKGRLKERLEKEEQPEMEKMEAKVESVE